jgi:hypothetical protein
MHRVCYLPAGNTRTLKHQRERDGRAVGGSSRTRLLGNAHTPSVTVRERSKLAPEVARRFLSLSALLASVLASRSSVIHSHRFHCQHNRCL